MKKKFNVMRRLVTVTVEDQSLDYSGWKGIPRTKRAVSMPIANGADSEWIAITARYLAEMIKP